MTVDIILVTVFGLAVVGLVALVARKFPVLRLTNPIEPNKTEQRVVKQQLVEARLMRQATALKRWLQSSFKRFRARAGAGTAQTEGRLAELEDWLRHRLEERTSPERTMADFLKQAEVALSNDDTDAAEHAYLEIIRRDPHHLVAYQGLGEVYLGTRDYEAAREVFEYLLKRGQADTSALGLARVASGQGRLSEAREGYLKVLAVSNAVQPHLELARILRELGQAAEALEHLKSARELEPNNPKILDFFIELSILNEQPNQAHEALATLREANPENQKIAELEREINELEQKVKPKRVGRSSRSRSFGLPTGKH